MVLYGPTAYLTKVSLLWIMTRIFSPYRKVVILIYVFLALMLTYYIPAVIVKIRVCAPIAKFWNPSLNGSCLDSVAIYLADAVISVISDLIILMLPCPLTLSLQLPLRKRVRVMAILGAGGIACACSIIRLVLIVKNSSSKDRTYEFMRINMLGFVLSLSFLSHSEPGITLLIYLPNSNAEIAIGVICACLPALTALISRVLHEYSSKRGTSDSRHELSRTPRATNGPHSATATTISTASKNRNRLSLLLETDQEFLVQSSAQWDPKIETMVHTSPNERPGEGDGSVESGSAKHSKNTSGGIHVMRTVDVSTSIVSLR